MILSSPRLAAYYATEKTYAMSLQVLTIALEVIRHYLDISLSTTCCCPRFNMMLQNMQTSSL